MKAVSRFEANLLNVLRFFLRRVPPEQALPLLGQARARPRCLGSDAVDLVEDTLAKGCMALLARTGGWRRERHLRGERVVEGRLWQRTPPRELGLRFSRHALEFLLWITATPLPAGKPSPSLTITELTIGDWLLFYFAYSALPRTLAQSLAALLPFAHNPICWLSFPTDFGETSAVVDFAPWTRDLGACMLEALQPELRARWEEEERVKARYNAAAWVLTAGRTQVRVLESFFPALEAAGRFDLARFFLQAASTLLVEPEFYGWIDGLDLSGQRLADRAEVYRAALAVPRGLQRLRDWERQARAVGYHDEGYAAAQLFKSDWEHWHGDDRCAAAEALLRRWQPI